MPIFNKVECTVSNDYYCRLYMKNFIFFRGINRIITTVKNIIKQLTDQYCNEIFDTKKMLLRS